MKKTAITVLAIISISCQSKEKQTPNTTTRPMTTEQQKDLETATFAGGCFWCTEAIFLELEGVKSVTSGYTGGERANPTYEQVSSGATGHAEATQIVFDPKVISFTLNRQGADIGTQYRSEVFYHSERQKKITEDYIAQMTSLLTFGKPIVTRVSKAVTFYPAEDYHQNYYSRNQNQSYCHYVITPKVEKVKKLYKDKLKK
jgi:peptide-methionine (S)-S-oxide reductase